MADGRSKGGGNKRKSGGGTTKPPVACSFCGKSELDVDRIIAGPPGVYICNECVLLCENLLELEEDAFSLTKMKIFTTSRRR